jgi:long-chain fatty acid transport protein
MLKSGTIVPLLSVLVFLISGSHVHAQSNDQGLAFLEFQFENPGARALGMGGAFIGMADDATAAVANPAGLTILIHPEASIEFRATHYRNEIPWYSGTRTSDVVDVNRDLQIERNFDFDFKPRDFPSSPQSLSFASFVYPIRINKFVISGQFNESAAFNRKFQTAGFEYLGTGIDAGTFAPLDSSLQFSIKNFGVSSAYRLSQRFNLGVTFNISRLHFDGKSRVSVPNFLGERDSISSDDTGVSFTTGLLVKASKSISVGAVYSHRPTFSITSHSESFGLFGWDVETKHSLRIPDSLGAGISWQANDRFSWNVDVVRVRYSQLMDHYYNSLEGIPFAAPPLDEPQFQKSSLEVSDATEFRTGAEYVIFAHDTPISLRGGYWREPFHSIVNKKADRDLQQTWETFEDPCGCGAETDLTSQEIAAPYLSRSLIRDTNHISVGAGFHREEISLDFGYDYSKTSQRFVISTVFYFKRLI